MKAQLIKVPQVSDASFTFRQFKYSNINSRWHFHSEIELIKIHNGKGTQFIGDNIKRFEADDIVLVGSNIPHFWRYDDEIEMTTDTLYSTVIHFTEHLWGRDFFNLPENISLKSLIEKSNRGLLVKGRTRDKVSNIIDRLKESKGTYRLIHLLECLIAIANGRANEVIPITSLGYEHQVSVSEQDRINLIYEYAFKNFKEKIPLKAIAAEIGFAPSSFCRYFKSKTGKSFTDFILELRVGHACKLLHHEQLNVKQICYESGFNNFTSFHKHFKSITGLSPQNYQKAYFIRSDI